jgi:hypothetical protein
MISSQESVTMYLGSGGFVHGGACIPITTAEVSNLQPRDSASR